MLRTSAARKKSGPVRAFPPPLCQQHASAKLLLGAENGEWSIAFHTQPAETPPPSGCVVREPADNAPVRLLNTISTPIQTMKIFTRNVHSSIVLAGAVPRFPVCHIQESRSCEDPGIFGSWIAVLATVSFLSKILYFWRTEEGASSLSRAALHLQYPALDAAIVVEIF